MTADQSTLGNKGDGMNTDRLALSNPESVSHELQRAGVYAVEYSGNGLRWHRMMNCFVTCDRCGEATEAPGYWCWVSRDGEVVGACCISHGTV